MIVSLPGGFARVTGMRTSDQAVAADKKGRRKGVQVHRLRQDLGDICRVAGHQHRVVETVVPDESLQPGKVFELVFFFKRKRYNFQALTLVLAVELNQKRCFIMAIGAPATSNVDQHNLAAKTCVSFSDKVALQVVG